MHILITVALSSVSIIALAAPAVAQEAQAAAVEDIYTGEGEIVVTARRREESLQDVPLSIQAVTGQDLQKLEIRQFEDITKVVPGLTLAKNNSSSSATIRGVNFDSRASGNATAVEFYRNDAVINSTALFQAVFDIGQIEVLRGPQGTLRGRASPSGSITVTTRRPDLSEPGGYVSGSLAERARWNFNGAVNVPVIGDKLAIRVAGFVGENRGNGIYGLNVPLNTIDRDIYDKTRALRASIRADPFDGMLVLDFNYETIKTASKQYSQVVSGSTISSAVSSTPSPRTITVDERLGVGSEGTKQDNTIKIYNWQAVMRQAGQRLTYVGSRQRLSLILNGASDGGGILSTLHPVNPPAFAPINQFGGYTDTEITQVTHELRLQNDERIGGLFDYVVGAFRVDTDSPTILATARGTITSSAGTPPLTPVYTLTNVSYSASGRLRTDQESSLFGNVTVHLGDRTEISGGLRHIWYKSTSSLRSGSFGTASAPLSPLNGRLIPAFSACAGYPGCGPQKETTIYAASIKHKLNDDLLIYATYGTSWRPGNQLVGYARTVPDIVLTPFLSQFINLADETSKSFEVGIKTAWLDQRLRLNASVFYQKFNNYPLLGGDIASVTTTGSELVPAFAFGAPVDMTVKGFEADLSFDVTRNFNVAATIAFANSKISKGVTPCVDLDNDNRQDSNASAVTAEQLFDEAGSNQVDTCSVVGESASSQPRWSGTVSAEYNHSLGFGDAFIRGFMAWKGATAGNPINANDDVGAYALVDLFAGVRAPDRAWEASLYVKNLFDKRKILGLQSGPSGTTSGSNPPITAYNYYTMGTTEPREVGLTLRYAFGSR